MKKRFFLPLLISATVFLVDSSPTGAFDIAGLQPIQPYGTFSSISAYTVSKNKFGAMFFLDKSIDPNFLRLSINAEYGLFENLDILASLPLILDFEDDEGLEGFHIGFKHNILKERRFGPSISYLVSFSVPGKDAFSPEGRYGGGLIVTKRLGPFSGNMNVLYHESTDSSLDEEIEARFGLDLAAAHNFNLLGELIVKKSHFSENIDMVEGRAGYRVKVSTNAFVILGIGYDFKNRSPELRLFFSATIFYPFFEPDVQRIYEEVRS